MSRQIPPRDEPPRRPFRRDQPRPEGPFERLLKQRPERDPAPIIIGGTIAFLAIVIILVFVFSSVLSGGGGNGGADDGQSIEVAPGVSGRLTTMPGLPPGLAAASQYIEFETDEAVPVTIALPLTVSVSGDAALGFYSFLDGRWQRIAESRLMPAQEFASEGCKDPTGTGGSLVSCGEFSSVPQNLAVLQVLAQTYTVSASLPSGGSLHADARPSIVSPRDYVPASDGSVVGTATDVTRGEGVLLMPTIVGSSTDTASVVDDILSDEDLRAQHVQQIQALVSGNNLDGIDLEYAAVDTDLDGEFTAFVSAVAQALHGDGKKLSLTVPPPGNSRSAYQFKQLGELVDYIKVLPIADPVSYWDNMPNALGALTEDVPPQKLLLVVSPFSIEVGESARAIGYQRAMLLASEAAVREPQNPEEIKPGATVRLVAANLDDNEGASTMHWDNEASAVSFTTGGNDRRDIYIENSFSVAFKLELIQAYGLGGVSVSDGSAGSDVANVWGRVNELVVTSTVALRRPNDSMLLPTWQAPEGGDLGAAAGTSATWVAPNNGTYHIVLAVSDGDRRFGQQIAIQVNESDEPSPSPFETFPPDTPEPSDTPEPTETPTPGVVEVGVVAEGDDDGGAFSNEEHVTAGSSVTYLVTFDNDSDVPQTVASIIDDTYGEVTCLADGGGDILGIVLAPDDGDAVLGPGNLLGGADELSCAFTATAPDSGSVTNTVTGTVEGGDGGLASDVDNSTIIVD